MKRILGNILEYDIALKPGDLILVPEEGMVKKKVFTRSTVSWMVFIASLGLVLALLI